MADDDSAREPTGPSDDGRKDGQDHGRSDGVEPGSDEFAEEVFEEESPSAADHEDVAGEPAADETSDDTGDENADESAGARNAQPPVSDTPDAAGASAPQPPAEASREDKLLDELQRLAAEYKNYRQRTEAQRELDVRRAQGAAAKALFPVFDDLDRAEQHGDLKDGGAFATIAAKVRGVGDELGLERFGAPGEAFDPKLHEAVLQQERDDVDRIVIGQVVAPGYRAGDLLLRAAKVVTFAPREADEGEAPKGA